MNQSEPKMLLLIISLIIIVVNSYKHVRITNNKLLSSSYRQYKDTNLNNIQLTILRSSSMDTDKCGPCPLAPNCKGQDREGGCDGSGKIQGGIATVSFLSCWPIKVYRPCPSYLAAGYQYRREGQTMDQVLFSEPSTKQQEKMASLKAEKAAFIAKQKESGTYTKDMETPKKIELNAAERFLEDTFGN